MEISEVGKNTFRAFKFKDDSVYYGETSHLDVNGNIENDFEKLDEQKIKSLKLIRHGFGIQLYGVDGTNCLCKYEGQWYKDNRTGKGICFFADKSTYEGSFVNGLFHGYGKFTWFNGNIYIGDWHYGKMEGEGEFKHWDGHIMKGTFRNNYHLEEGHNNIKFLVNPFPEMNEWESNKTKIIKNLKYNNKSDKKEEVDYIRYIETI